MGRGQGGGGESEVRDYATIKYNGATGQQQWVGRYDGPDNGSDAAMALALDSAGNVYVTGSSEGSGSSFDYATIKYGTAGKGVLGTAVQLADWVNALVICFDHPARWPGRGGLPIAFAGPSCPPPPDCPNCSLAAGWDPGETPSYLPEIYQEVLGALDPSRQWRFPTRRVSRLTALFKKAPAGRHYSRALKAQVLEALTQSTISLAPEVVVKVLEATNALELDWRVPHLARQGVNWGDYSAVGFQGTAWVAMRDVRKSGKLELRVENGLPVAAVGFKPGWPMATYTFDFTGQLGEDGYVDVSFHTGGRRFAGSLSRLRILEWDGGKLYKDITTHVDAQRGIITGRTNKPATFVLMLR